MEPTAGPSWGWPGVPAPQASLQALAQLCEEPLCCFLFSSKAQKINPCFPNGVAVHTERKQVGKHQSSLQRASGHEKEAFLFSLQCQCKQEGS